ncbi:hypothetical protein MKW94_001349 [Papaver nudicaule]|uniref:Uncharacterized protein n=1 Tax=Papaver nudicaule TaxID=74823 RepID=A0AA41RZ14_PAPNU|nr:hypothetical protein [Papaver nudicaule]
MESLNRRKTQPAISVFLSLFICLNLSVTTNSGKKASPPTPLPNDNELIHSHVRRLRPRQISPPTPLPNPHASKPFDVPPPPPPPTQADDDVLTHNVLS